MRFATLPNGTPDGRLHVISRDNARAAPLRSRNNAAKCP